MPEFSVNILGCGSATPSLLHYPSCQIVDHRNTLMMVDGGEGAQLQMRRMHLKFSRLRHIFISHLHGDHFLGLPGLLSTMSLHDIEGKVTVYTFPEGIDLLQHFMRVMCHETSFEIEYRAIKPDCATVLDTDSISVETFPLAHRVPCVGYIFREKPKKRHIIGDMVNFYNVPDYARASLKDGADFITPEGIVVPNSRLTTDPDPALSYAYCSDTAFTPATAEYVKGVHTLYHEATYADDAAAKAAPRGHSTAREAAQIALMAGARQLIIGHYSKQYNSVDTMLAEAREIFPNTIAAQEGMTIPII